MKLPSTNDLRNQQHSQSDKFDDDYKLAAGPNNAIFRAIRCNLKERGQLQRLTIPSVASSLHPFQGRL